MKDKTRMLLAGAGFMGKVHIEAAKQLDSVDYAGVFDTNTALASKFGEQYGIASFSDLEIAFAEISPDAVDICVPTPFHLPLIKSCAPHSVAVLCEKPIALNLHDAREIEALGSNTRIMLAQVLRFWPEYRYAINAIKANKFGPVHGIDCRRLSSPPGWNSWMLSPEVGGGTVIDLQIHDMDFIFQLVGMPLSITAKGREHSGAINYVSNSLDYESGIKATNEASYLMPDSFPFRMYFLIECEEAVLEFDFWNAKGERLQIFPQSGEPFSPELDDIDAYAAEIDYFAKSLQSSKPFDLVPLSESVKSLQLCLASKESCKTGSPVKLF